MQHSNSWSKLILLALLMTCGLLLGSLAGAAYAWMVLGEIPGNTASMIEQMDHSQIRVFITINQVFSFLIPGILGVYFMKFQKFSSPTPLEIWKYPTFIIWYFVSLPFFQWLFYVNFTFDVPSWWPVQVEAVPPILIEILSDMTLSELLVNTLVIAVIPAVGEELIFRIIGIPMIKGVFASGHLAVIITAFIFAVFHFDFQGILPRFFLGLLLGYAYLFSGKIWIPIIIHFIHNGSQLLFAYFSPSMIKDLNQNVESPALPWVITSLLFVTVMFWFLNKTRQRA